MNYKDVFDTGLYVDKAYIDGDFMVIHVRDKFGDTDELRVDISDLVGQYTDEEREACEALWQVLCS